MIKAYILLTNLIKIPEKLMNADFVSTCICTRALRGVGL